MKSNKYGRGSLINPRDHFSDSQRSDYHSLHTLNDDEIGKSQILEIEAKSILNKVINDDVYGEYSMNPYQGCSHGCAYCYARDTHKYWDLGTGLDFERKLMAKINAPELLDKALSSSRRKASVVVMSGNTDCYQPLEKEYKLSRKCLKVFYKYRHPVALITKNSLIERDIDILKKLADDQLCRVAVSLTTLDESLRRTMEPRTATARKKLKTIQRLSAEGIPVIVMIAPIIPSLNDTEIFNIAEASANAGAKNISYTVVRLNGDLKKIFSAWLEEHYPERKQKILNKIQSLHGGKVYDSRVKTRMKGEGNYSKIISDQFKLAKKKYFSDTDDIPAWNMDLYEQYRDGQLKLF